MKARSSISRLQELMRRGVIITASAGLALFGAGPTFVMAAGPQPNIQRITPNVTSAGGPGFTLVVNGPGFVAQSVVQWNGARRPSYFRETGVEGGNPVFRHRSGGSCSDYCT